MFIFAYPDLLWLLLLIPLIVMLYVWARFIRNRRLKKFGNLSVLTPLMPEVSLYKPHIKITIQMLALAMIIIAVARPWGGVKDQKTTKEGIEVIIAMDVSNSMLASSNGEEGGTSRLRTAKLIMERLINQFDNNRVGLIVYAGEAYTLLPVTSDYVSAKMFLNSINPDMVPIQGTNIAQAIHTAINSYSGKKGIGRALIVITDAEDLEGSALEAAQEAAKSDIQVDVIGVGSTKGTVIPIGNGQYFKDDAGNIVTTALNEQLGIDVAKAGHGIYVNANNSDALSELQKQLDKVQKSAMESSVYSIHDELFPIFVWFALIFLIIDVLVLDKKIGWLGKITFFKKEEKK